MTIYVMRGLPASGKSTWANKLQGEYPTKYYIVSRDRIRFETYGKFSGLTQTEENVVTEIEEERVRAATLLGFDVIVDAMHLKAKYARKWFEYSDDVVFVRCEQPLDTLLHRNRGRAAAVPEEEIRDLYQRFTQKGKINTDPKRENTEPQVAFEPVENMGILQTYIVDIDGTLAHNDGHRGWHEYEKVGDDKPHLNVIKTVRALSGTADIVYFSGRKEYCRSQTEEWLERHDLPAGELHMRADDDHRKDDVVKYEMLQKFLESNPIQYITGVIDDRPRVLRMWRAAGLTTFRVGDPCGPDF